MLAEEEVNSSHGVGSGDGAQAAAFLGIGPADITRHKQEKSETVPGKEHSYCFPLHILTAGQCKQHEQL